ncbi:MAG: FG-GAP repeat protein [Caldilineaceae bacterium]
MPATSSDQANGWRQTKIITAPDATQYDKLGAALALDGDYLAVGATDVDMKDITIQRGVVYLFARDQGGKNQWGLATKLQNADDANDTSFGEALAISGELLAVGTPEITIGDNGRQGAVYLFARNPDNAASQPGQWHLLKKLVAKDGTANAWFGMDVALDHDTVAVGAWGADVGAHKGQGAVYLFARDQGGQDAWGLVQKVTSTDGQADDQFGAHVALHGDLLAVSATDATMNGLYQQGAVYTFQRTPATATPWRQIAKIGTDQRFSPWHFSPSIALSDQRLVAGDPEGKQGPGAVYLFGPSASGATTWTKLAKLTPQQGATWDQFGAAVAGDTEHILIGAYEESKQRNQEGAVYLFARSPQKANEWTQSAKLLPSDGANNDWFGWHVALRGNTIAVVAQAANVDAAQTIQGKVYLFEH